MVLQILHQADLEAKPPRLEGDSETKVDFEQPNAPVEAYPKRPTKEEIAMKSLIFAILLTCVLSVAAFGQVITGSVKGTISDSKGAVVSGADLKLTNSRKGEGRTAKTNASGTI